MTELRCVLRSRERRHIPESLSQKATDQRSCDAFACQERVSFPYMRVVDDTDQVSLYGDPVMARPWSMI
jgi:hypothetical protein